MVFRSRALVGGAFGCLSLVRPLMLLDLRMTAEKKKHDRSLFCEGYTVVHTQRQTRQCGQLPGGKRPLLQ